MAASQPARRKPGRPALLADLGPAPRLTPVPVRAPLRTLAATLRADADLRESHLRLAARSEEQYIRRLREQADALDNAANAVPEAPGEPYISLAAAERQLQKGKKQILRWVASGQLPCLRDPLTGAPCKPYRIRTADLDRLFRGGGDA